MCPFTSKSCLYQHLLAVVGKNLPTVVNVMVFAAISSDVMKDFGPMLYSNIAFCTHYY